MSAYEPSVLGLPPIELQNWYAEAAPEKPSVGARLMPCAGSVSFASGMRDRPTAIMQADGLFNGDAAVIAGDSLYQISASGSGTRLHTLIKDDYRSQFAWSQTEAVCVTGGRAFVVWPSLAEITLPTSPVRAITGVLHVQGRFIFLEDGSGRYWFSDPFDAATIKPTSFVTTESTPDGLAAITDLGRDVVLMGYDSIEIHQQVNSFQSPFVPIPGGVVRDGKGIAGPDAWVQSDYAVFYAGKDNFIYRMRGVQVQQVPAPHVERILTTLPQSLKRKINLWVDKADGHHFIGVDIPSHGTFVVDLTTNLWHRQRGPQGTLGVSGIHFQAFNRRLCADRESGSVLALRNDTFTHSGAVVKRLATAIIPSEDGRQRITGAALHGSMGSTANPNARPEMFMEWSDDGLAFGNPVGREIGGSGQRNWNATWGNMGLIKPPHKVFRLSMSDDVGVAVYGAVGNPVRP